ncbi:S8 family serine peptidase [Streptomyces sp. OF3]|uniref:S8 family serine peptidase n=1 Tax=Streptomyces alkaliterrae TaxID=2213162 RepID=A0A7W3ZMV1_9ACTN|nr:S8 family serine peptidase [Streptomyces alkaliterrae]MBB1253752.1 S8 family serine peptidase [Streptomyces alkaliterrae]
MGTRRALSAVGSALLAGALLLGSAPTASADQTRDGQWALEAFQVEKVWKESTGKGVTVAVLDSAVKGSHPDLSRNVLPGRDMLRGGPATLETEIDHATGLASLIAGHGHGAGNKDGVIGLAPDAKILPVRIATEGDSANEAGDSGQFGDAIRYAVDEGASIINMSIGRSSITDNEKEALAYAAAKDVLVVSSAGNVPGHRINYPAREGSVVAVGAIDQAGNIWEDSSAGPEMMLTAPGHRIRMAATREPYQVVSGTSYASAYVSGAAALLRAKFPDLTAGQIVNRLAKTALLPDAVDAPNGRDKYYGFGMIRPYRALTEDIPAGPKSGPLEIPDPPKSDPNQDTAGAVAPGDNQAAEDDLTTGQMVLIGGIGVLVLGSVVVLLIVSALKKKRRNTPPPPPPGWGGPGGMPTQQPPAPPGAYQQQGPPQQPPRY